MLPVFNQYRKMLNDFNVDLSDYDEDKLWIHRLIIRGFDKNGNDKKILRLKINDNLEYEYKIYDDAPKNEELETYEQTYSRMENKIAERESIDVIKKSIKKYKDCSLFVSTSMGKDSKLLEHILKKVTTNYRILFNNTTCDSLDVYKEVLSRPEIEIITKKDKNGNNLSIYNMFNKYGFPSRQRRWCCSTFKEGAIKEYLSNENNIIEYLGMRNEESKIRENYQFEKQDDRFNNNWHIFLPIRKWTELELWLYTIHNRIPINSKYLKGYSRVGCHIVCPFYTKSTWILDKYWYKQQYERFRNKLKNDFINRQLWTVYNCTIEEYLNNWNNGVLRNEPTEEVILEFMKYKNFDNYQLAKKYFNKYCCSCNKKVNHKNEIAMNLKLFGRNTNNFYCKKCFMKKMDWTKNQYEQQIEKFKENECNLF